MNKQNVFLASVISLVLLSNISIAQMTPTYEPIEVDGELVGFYSYSNSMCVSISSCLNSKDVTMYYLETCPHCHNQFNILGGRDNVINKVECSLDQEECLNNNIQAVPTWKINGNIYQGVRSAQELNVLSGCLI